MVVQQHNHSTRGVGQGQGELRRLEAVATALARTPKRFPAGAGQTNPISPSHWWLADVAAPSSGGACSPLKWLSTAGRWGSSTPAQGGPTRKEERRACGHLSCKHKTPPARSFTPPVEPSGTLRGSALGGRAGQPRRAPRLGRDGRWMRGQQDCTDRAVATSIVRWTDLLPSRRGWSIDIHVFFFFAGQQTTTSLHVGSGQNKRESRGWNRQRARAAAHRFPAANSPACRAAPIPVACPAPDLGRLLGASRPDTTPKRVTRDPEYSASGVCPFLVRSWVPGEPAARPGRRPLDRCQFSTGVPLIYFALGTGGGRPPP